MRRNIVKEGGKEGETCVVNTNAFTLKVKLKVCCNVKYVVRTSGCLHSMFACHDIEKEL